MSNTCIQGISSMATRQLLAELVQEYKKLSAGDIVIESVGGVDAAKRVLAGECFDVVILASDALDRLITAQRVEAASKVNLVHSGVAIAIKSGARSPDISSASSVKEMILAAKSISYSTGPSGVALVKLFETWGIADTIASRVVQAPPGVPVGSLVANGDVALGFQQLSELIHLEGIQIVGPLPPEIQITTTFSAGICTTSQQKHLAQKFLTYMVSPAATPAKLRQGMENIT